MSRLHYEHLELDSSRSKHPKIGMAGLVPAIHVDPRDKPGDDGWGVNELAWLRSSNVLIASALGSFVKGIGAKHFGVSKDLSALRAIKSPLRPSRILASFALKRFSFLPSHCLTASL